MNPHRKSRQQKRARTRRWVRAFETLESRWLLTGDFVNYAIDDARAAAIQDGVVGLAGFGDRLSDSGDFANPLKFLRAPDSSSLTLGGLAPVGQILSDDFVAPLERFLIDQAIDRSTDAAIALLSSLPHVVSVTGGYTTSPTEEIRFEMHLRREIPIREYTLEFGPGADGFGRVSTIHLETAVVLDMQVAFGVSLDDSLNSEQAFFIRDLELNVSLEADAAADLFTWNVGILEVSAPEAIFRFAVNLHVGQRDPEPDAFRQLILSELNGYDILELSETTLTENSIDTSIDVEASMGDWTVTGSPTVQVIGQLIGVDPTITWDADFSQLLPFLNLSTEDLVDGTERVGSWLSALSDTELLDINVPFTKSATLGSVYDVGSAFNSIIASMRDRDGAPSFGSAQEFPYSGASGIDFDPVTNQLFYFVSRRLPGEHTASRNNWLEVRSSLGMIAEVPVDIFADGSVRYGMVIDLDDPSLPIDQRMQLVDFAVRADVQPSVAGVSGQAAYGGLGLSYSDASLAGSYAYALNIGDANPVVGGLTINELFSRLSDPSTLLQTPAEFSGTSELRVSGLSVLGGLFTLPSTAAIVASASDLATGAIDFIVENSPDLRLFENITVESVVDSLAETLVGTDLWAGRAETEPLAVLGATVEDFVDIRQSRIANAITDGIGEVQDLLEADRPILQNLPAYLESLVVTTRNGAINLTSNVAYDAFNSFELSLDAEMDSTSSQVGLGLGFESLFASTGRDLVGETSDFVGQLATADAAVSYVLSLGIELDASNTATPTAYLGSGSFVESTVFLDSFSAGNLLSMDGAVGATGIELTDGRVVIAQDLNSPNASAPATFRKSINGARIPVNQVRTYQPQTADLGALKADFAVVPDSTGSATEERLAFQVQDFGLPLTSTVLISSPSFPDLHAGADLPNELQAVPPSLDAIFRDLSVAMRDSVFRHDFPLIGDNLDGPANFFRKIRAELLPIFNAISVFNAVEVENAIESALANLMGRPGDYVTVDLDIPTEIGFTIDFAGAILNERIRTETDLGLPALGASLDAELSVTGTYDFAITIIVSVVDGVYIDPGSENISIALDVNANGVAMGRLGFLDVVATAAANDPTCGAFSGRFSVAIADPNSDGRLTLSELATGGVIDPNGTGFAGCSAMRFDIEASVSDWLPSVVTDLSVDWTFDGIDLDGNIPTVEFGGVGIKLGQFLSHTIAPFLVKIEKILEPIEPVLEVLDTPLPVIDQFRDPISMLSVARDLLEDFPSDSSFVQSINSIVQMLSFLVTLNDLANIVELEKGSEAVIEIGNLNFGGTASPQFDARLPVLDVDVLGQIVRGDDWVAQMEAPSAAPQFSAELKKSPGRIHFPIFENPAGVFEWLFGFGETELIAWELPSVFLNIPFDIPIPIFPGILQAKLYGGIEASFSITVGIDTYGVALYRQTGNVSDLLAGFYVSDTNQPDGSGDDIPELPIEGKVIAALGVGYDVGGVGLAAFVGGGIYATLDLDLIDHDGDGKLRGQEFLSPDGCIAVRGGVGVTLEASYTAGPLSGSLPLVRGELGNFNTIIPCPDYDGSAPPPARLARLDSATGELTLLVGELASERDVRQNERDETYFINRFDGKIIVSAFGYRQEFDVADVATIVGHAGDGDDRILIDSSVRKRTFIYGEEGDDFLKGGSGDDTLDGGDGFDELLGGAGSDTLRGGDGDDELLGEEDGDFLYGDKGDDTILGGMGDDIIETGDGLNFAYGDEDNDTIMGGIERDAIYGGSGNDTIWGRDGDDSLVGESGIDTISGELGNDVIDGGDGFNTLSGNEGDDTITGGNEGNDVSGGIGRDYIQGGLGVDVIHGGLGRDTLRGGGGADEIYGDEGDDTIYGEAGTDLIRGNDGDDWIDGGSEEDAIHGDDGDDLIYGGAHRDTIEGSAGNDEIYGQTGNDVIYGGTNQLAEDGSAPDYSDSDRLYGDDGADSIYGGFGADQIAGGSGPDTLQGNEDADTIEGDEGNDTIYGDDGPDFQRHGIGGADFLFGELDDDEIFGGEANDFIRGGKGDDQLWGEQGLDQLFGDTGNDLLDGGPDADELDGSDGDDHLLGRGDNDRLFGNLGADLLEGNLGDDFLRGNAHSDLLFGDDGDDDLGGDGGNDTLRGGDGVDLLHGNLGDDLLVGHTGDDSIFGDDGDDVIYGHTGRDHLDGGLGNDRLYGELGDDVLRGDEGDDVLEGGLGDDSLSGDGGNDQLYGDSGVDDVSGGDGDDFLNAGNGIGDYLRGDAGNDTIVGSDDGSDDPKFGDTTFFGDRIEGGTGSDTIDGLGGADEIDGGGGNDWIHGGEHGDRLIGGPSITTLPPEEDNDQVFGWSGDDEIDGGIGDDVIVGGTGVNAINDTLGNNSIDLQSSPVPAFMMSSGLERRGRWSQLSGSASDAGLSFIGGFEQSILATQNGVYVAWVDWRNGNSEIYLAFHPNDVGQWQQIGGVGGNPSASGGGVSNDPQQSRRPVIFIPPNEDDILVAWTSISEDGTSNIEIARRSDNWGRVANPAQTGNADHARFVPYSDESGLLTWIDSSSGFKNLAMAQYVNEPSCFVGFLGARAVATGNINVTSYDMDAVMFRGVAAISYGDSSDHDIDVLVTRQVSLLTEAALCPFVPNANVDVMAATGWERIETLAADDLTDPTVGIQLLSVRSQGQNEVEIETDVYVAWQSKSDRSDQVAGVAIRQSFNSAPLPAEPLIPQYVVDTAARDQAESISHTFGYAAKPDLAVSNYGANLAWMDDGVFNDDGKSHVYVMSNFGNANYPVTPYVLYEMESQDASGRGISPTGGSLQRVSVSVTRDGLQSTLPYVAWTEANVKGLGQSTASTSGVYLRVSLPGSSASDDVLQIQRDERLLANLLDNDDTQFGEFAPSIMQFDGKEIDEIIEFRSELGGLVRVRRDGTFSYDPRTSRILMAMLEGDSRTETFVYKLTDGIYTSEAQVVVTIRGSAAEFDFGDLPDSYLTTTAVDGPRHLPIAGMFLGDSVTIEPDAVADTNASTDTADDGVRLPQVLIPGFSANFFVSASVAGRIDAFADYNLNGQFDSSERITPVAGWEVMAGTNRLTVEIPATASVGNSALRFRFSTVGGLEAFGPSDDGEVEDYRILISLPAPGTITLLPDPTEHGKSMLFVRGTNGNDRLIVSVVNNQARASINGMTQDTGLPTSQYVVFGLAGDDDIRINDMSLPGYIDAGTGNDTVRGGVGPDRIFGRSGNDTLYGREGDDVLWGGVGDDTLYSNAGIGYLFGQAGNDKLFGNGVLVGGAGGDEVSANGARNVLIGGLGIDLLNGANANQGDILIAGGTNFDEDEAALRAIRSAWLSSTAVATRIAYLEGTLPGGPNANSLLNASTVAVETFPDVVVNYGTRVATRDDWLLLSDGDIKVNSPGIVTMIGGSANLSNRTNGQTYQSKLFETDRHNVFMPSDVNDDGVISPVDVLMVVDVLYQAGKGIDILKNTQLFVDVNADGVVSPLDALKVIDELRRRWNG